MSMTLDFEDRQICLFPGETVLTALKRSGVPIAAGCGGKNRCGSCKIKLLAGSFIYEGQLLEISADIPVEVNACALHMISARGKAAFLQKETMPPECVIPLSVSRGADTQGTFAVLDLGTTNIAAALVRDGKICRSAETPNRQSRFGSNIIDRIAFAASPERLQLLRDALIKESAAPLLADLIPPNTHLEGIIAAGNTAMTCFFFGTDPAPLGHAPFELKDLCIEQTAGGIGLAQFPADLPIRGVPHLHSFIGGDVLAGAALAGFGTSDCCELYLDIGTNCEMLLNNRGRFYALSAAAGPAFERHRLARNTIRHLHLQNGNWITDPPAGSSDGLRGTALIDLMCESAKAGLLDDFGKWVRQPRLPGIPLPDNEELAELITAKAAISSGRQLLFERAGIKAGDIDRVCLAGSFSYHLDIDNAQYLDLLPPIPRTRFIKLGNAALAGAAAWGFAPKPADSVALLRNGIIHINPAEDPENMTRFASAMKIK